MLGSFPQEIAQFIPGVKTVRDLLPYREETTVNGDTTVQYYEYIDGKMLCRLEGSQKREMLEHPHEIFRVTTTKSGTTTTIVREHTNAKWADRAASSTVYTPIHNVLQRNEDGSTKRMF